MSERRRPMGGGVCRWVGIEVVSPGELKQRPRQSLIIQRAADDKKQKKEAERTLSVMRYAMRTINWGPEAKGQTWRHNLRQALAALGPGRESEGERVEKKKGKGNERPGLGPARGWCSWSGLEEMREGVVCVLRLVSRKAHRAS